MRSDTHYGPTWASEQVEAYLDDLLTPQERLSFEEELENSFELREELDAARQFNDLLHSLPVQKCPEHVTRQVLEQVHRQSNTRCWWSWPALAEWFTPRSSLALAAGACAVVLILLFQPQPAMNPAPTPREVRHAERQIEATMAYLARVGVRTSVTVQNEVYRSAVVVPIKETVRVISQTSLAASIKSVGNKEI